MKCQKLTNIPLTSLTKFVVKHCGNETAIYAVSATAEAEKLFGMYLGIKAFNFEGDVESISVHSIHCCHGVSNTVHGSSWYLTLQKGSLT